MTLGLSTKIIQGRIQETYQHCFHRICQETGIFRRCTSVEDLASSSPLALLTDHVASTRTQKGPLSAPTPLCSSLRVVSACKGKEKAGCSPVRQHHKLASFHPRQVLIFSPSRAKPRSNPSGSMEYWET